MNVQKANRKTYLKIGLVTLLIGVMGIFCWNYFRADTLHISYDAPSYRSLEDLTANAEYIVVGTYTSFEGTWNMSRDPEDISREAVDSYVEGRLYHFQVSSVLKGELSDPQIQVNLRYGEQVTFEGDSVFVTNPNYIEPTLDQTYILFLTKEQSQAFDGYYGTGCPFAIKLEDSGSAQLEINQVPDNGVIVSEETTSAGKQLVIEKNVGEPWEDHISGMSANEVLEKIQNML